MLKVAFVEIQSPMVLKCTFTNGAIKWLDVAPLLKNHSHLKGIEKLWDPAIFSMAKVGELGEVLWPSLIHTVDLVHGPTVWDYDISAEYIFAVGTG